MPYSPSDPWLIPFLKRVSARPGMFLASENVAALSLYLQAYGQARVDLGLPEFGRGEETLLADFTAWLMARSASRHDHGWQELIHFANPDARNVQTFFSLFEEFLLARGDDRWGAGEGVWPPAQ